MNKIFTIFIFIFLAIVSLSRADVYINVVAVNGAPDTKTSPIHFDLPGELTAQDIIDTNGLQLDYSVEDANYFVYGDVTLKPKESKTFRIQVKDKWQLTPDNVTTLKGQIDNGYQKLGAPYNAANAQILKDRLENKIDYIVNLQSTSTDSVEKRIANYRIYTKELKRIQNSALDVAYWRSDPNNEETPRTVYMVIEVNNPSKETQTFKHKDYLPAEVKVEDVVDPQDFEVRFDAMKQLAFLFKEEDLKPGEKKKYTIGILDIWSIGQKDIDYLRSRSNYAYDYLKDSKYQDTAKILMDRITGDLKDIEDSQAVQRPLMEHISAFRANTETYNNAKQDVETLERLLAVFREDLQKSKVENVLSKMQSLKGVADISKVMFNKKFEQSTAWSFIGWILLFVGVVTLGNFIVWLLRAKDKKIEDAPPKKE